MRSKSMMKSVILLIALFITFSFTLSHSFAEDDMLQIIAGWECSAAPKTAAVPATVGIHATNAFLTNSMDAVPSYNFKGLEIGQWDNGAVRKYWQISLSTVQYKDIALYAKVSSSETGPRDFQMVYSTDDGVNWRFVPNGAYTIQANCDSAIQTVALPKDTYDIENLIIRLVMITDSSLRAGTDNYPAAERVQGLGTSRINNIIISGISTIGGKSEFVAPVTAAPGSGKISTGTKLELSCTDKDAVIMYSINEREFIEYDATEQITLNKLPATVKTYAAKDGQTGSIASFYFESLNH